MLRRKGTGRQAAVAILLAVVGACAAGCSGDTTGPATREEVLVFGYLYVGEPVDAANAIHVSRVRPIDQAYDPVEAAVSDAIVMIAREGAAAETLSLVGPGAYARAGIVVEPSTTYQLRIEIPGERLLTATTTTPPAIEVSGGPPEIPGTVRQEVLQDSFPVFIESPDPQQVLLTDVYCLEHWEDARYINPFGPDDEPASYEEYGEANGEPRHIFAYFRADDVVEEEDGRYRVDFYGAMMVFYGRYTVQVMAIDDNVYSYLYKDHPEENGGIAGGLGVFGSAARRVWEVEVE